MYRDIVTEFPQLVESLESMPQARSPCGPPDVLPYQWHKYTGSIPADVFAAAFVQLSSQHHPKIKKSTPSALWSENSLKTAGIGPFTQVSSPAHALVAL
jgi:hypothetical protein